MSGNNKTSEDANALEAGIETVASEISQKVSANPGLAGLPSMDDLFVRSNKILALVKSGDHVAVEKFLSERGHTVVITPKVGCPAIHYSKLNPVNVVDDNLDSPLILAVKVDCRMVDIVLKYGGNPNHVNRDRDTPLSIAANRGDRDVIDALLRAGANLRAAVVKLTSTLRYMSEQQLKKSAKAGFSVRPLTVLLSDDVYLKCRDPIKISFDVCKDIKRIKNVRDEFKIEFELLMKEADVFAYKFLNHCDNMYEAREILTSGKVNLLRQAVENKKKRFVSHPFSQQIINEQWYGDTANRLFFGKTTIALQYSTSLVTLPLLFLKFLLFDACSGVPFMDSKFSDLMRLLFTPCLCFATDAINYVIFLGILVTSCLYPFPAGTYEISPIEYVLYYCVFARILIEGDLVYQQGWRKYFKNFWNFVDISVIILLVTAGIYKSVIQYIVAGQELKYFENEDDEYSNIEALFSQQHRNSMDVNYIYAVTEFILTIRLLSLLEISKSMGTMLIALKYLVADVARFSIILLLVVLGTSVSIFSMTVALSEWNKELEQIRDIYSWPDMFVFKKLPKGKIVVPEVFETFTDTVRNILWGTFGLLDVVSIKIEEEQETTDFINVMLILYILLSCVLLLNMLIGILSSTFDMVKENCDIEWKFARSQLLKEYSRAQPFLFPFFPFLFPFIFWFRAKLADEQRKNTEKSITISDLCERDELINTVSDRFAFGNLVGMNDGAEGENFETRMKSKKQKSVMLQIAQKIKKKK
ncbi:hypothetical protein ACHWQZ_G018875 [Mnemiopsis leidyi]